MQAANGVLTCFRSVERLIASEFAGTSGAHHVYLDRIGSAATWSSKIPACQPCAGSFSTPAYLLQLISKHCTYSPAVARQLADNSRTSPAASFRLSSLLLSIPKNTFRQQHGFKTETSAKSLWQQGYNTPGFGYRRSYSIWDGDNILYGLIAANLGGFLLWQSYPGLMYRHATVSVNSVREGRVYTLLTSAFSHNAFNHILANMVTFYFFGRSMSCILGGKKLLLLYVAGGLAGSLAHVTQYYIQAQSTGASAWIKEARMASTPVALGASAAVNAIVMLQVMLFPQEMIYIYMVLPVPAAAFGLLYIVGDMFGMLGMGSGGNIAHAGHLGGAAVGAAAFLLLRRGRLRW